MLYIILNNNVKDKIKTKSYFKSKSLLEIIIYIVFNMLILSASKHIHVTRQFVNGFK